MIDERGLPSAAPGNNTEDLDVIISPSTLELRHFPCAAYEILSGHRQVHLNFRDSALVWMLHRLRCPNEQDISRRKLQKLGNHIDRGRSGMFGLPTQKSFKGTAVELHAGLEVLHCPIHFGQALRNFWDIQATFHHHRPRTDLGSRLLPTFAPFLYRNAGGVGKSENVTVRQRTRKTLSP
jgi:hypothetical protein